MSEQKQFGGSLSLVIASSLDASAAMKSRRPWPCLVLLNQSSPCEAAAAEDLACWEGSLACSPCCGAAAPLLPLPLALLLCCGSSPDRCFFRTCKAQDLLSDCCMVQLGRHQPPAPEVAAVAKVLIINCRWNDRQAKAHEWSKPV